jgi:hypothetical protein
MRRCDGYTAVNFRKKLERFMKTYIAIFTLLFSLPSLAAGFKTENEIKSLCAASAKDFGQGNVEATFNKLKPHWPLPVEEIDSLSYQTKTQMDMVKSRFGKILGSDYVSAKKAGASLAKYSYAIKFEKHAVRYMCIVYKPRDLWIINSIYWDDQIDLLFE